MADINPYGTSFDVIGDRPEHQMDALELRARREFDELKHQTDEFAENDVDFKR